MPKENRHLVLSIFMPLNFMDEKQYNEFMKEKPELIFEYLDKATPRAINEYPTFSSFQYLNREDYLVFFDYYKKFTNAMKNID